MPDLLLNAQPFKFNTKGGSTLDLYGQLLSSTTRIGIRLANHEYVKRDGGEVEPMGARQGHWAYRCCFLGEGVTRNWKALVQTIRREPIGQLIDPRLGSINAACEGAEAQEDPETALNLLHFTISFVENAVDTAIVNDSEIGPQQRASQVSEALLDATAEVADIASNRIANTVYAAAVAAMANFALWADKFRTAALAAAQSKQPDPTLPTLLATVLTKRDLALVALTATLAQTLESDVSLTDARTDLYVAYAACQQLYGAVLAQLPPVVPFTVPTAMTRNAILVRLYGAEARAEADNFDRLNRLPTPHWVPAGTLLQVVAPRVPQ
jgi:prophage DNA circulation protein